MSSLKIGERIHDLETGEVTTVGKVVLVEALRRHITDAGMAAPAPDGKRGSGDRYKVSLKTALDLASRGVVFIVDGEETDAPEPTRVVETKEGATSETPAAHVAVSKESVAARRGPKPKAKGR